MHTDTRAVYELKGRKKYKLTLVSTGKGGLKDFRKHLSDRKVKYTEYV